MSEKIYVLSDEENKTTCEFKHEYINLVAEPNLLNLNTAYEHYSARPHCLVHTGYLRNLNHEGGFFLLLLSVNICKLIIIIFSKV